MAAVRKWHPVRLALVCAVLAMAGGASSARAVYAEVSARAVAAARAEHATERAAAVERPVVAPASPLASVVAPPSAPSLVVAPLYLAHCALLL